MRSAGLPARLVGTRTGLYFEWGLSARAKLQETSAVILSDEAAWNLKRDLLCSSWQPPPSIRIPELLEHTVLDLSIESLCIRDIQRAWTAALRRRFGSQVFNLCLRIVPKGATLFDLSQVAANQSVLNHRLNENPALAPLLAGDRGMWRNLPNWRVVKNRMLAQGLAQQSWRWLARQKKAYVARIGWSQPSHLCWVNFHAALDRDIPVSRVDKQTAAIQGFVALSTWLRRNHEQLHTAGALNILRGVRLALQRHENTASMEHRFELVQEEFPLIADWLLGSAGSTAPHRVVISRSWTYDTLMARQTQWHLVEWDVSTSRPNVFWPEVIGMGSVANNIDFIELTSLNALLSEAKKMHHCVPSYIDRCIAGDVCIFHLQIKGRAPERATLEFRKAGANGWQISQLKGPCNAPVSGQLWAAAHLLLNRLN